MLISYMMVQRIVSGMLQRIVTFPVESHWNCPTGFQWHAPRDFHFFPRHMDTRRDRRVTIVIDVWRVTFFPETR